LSVDRAERAGERRPRHGRMVRVERTNVELAAPFENGARERSAGTATAVRGLDKEMRERGGRAVHVQARDAAVRPPVAARVGRRLEAEERGDLVGAPCRLARVRLV